MTNEILLNEGKIVSAGGGLPRSTAKGAKPRRGSLLFKKLMVVTVAALAVSSGFGAWNVRDVHGLTNALTQINSGVSSDKTINLAPDYYDVSTVQMCPTGCLLIAQSSVVIQGTDTTCWRDTVDRKTKAVLDAKGKATVICLYGGAQSSCAFRHLTIENGTNMTYGVHGGGIANGSYNNKCSATNCVFLSNYTEKQGGGAHNITPTNCRFAYNYGIEGGGYLAGGPAIDCLFEYNKSQKNGGAARNGGNLTRCVFIGNVSGQQCSCNYGGAFTATDCLCISNTASKGGCFTSEDFNSRIVTIKDSKFFYNKNSGNNPGGAVVSVRTVTNCVFVGNSVPAASGGAIYAEANAAVIVDCVFTNNTCFSTGGGGGAIGGSTNPGCQPFVTLCDFYGNSATNKDNTSGGSGGAVRAVVISNCTIRACQAQYGGALGYLTDAYDVKIFDCHALIQGGAAQQATMTDCLVSNCTCAVLTGSGGTSGEAEVIRRVKFVDCHSSASNTVATASEAQHLVDCEFVNCNPHAAKSGTRCRVIGNGVYHSIANFRKVAGGSYTNCLFTNISANYIFDGASFVNCTIISNNYEGSGQLFANTTRAWNCIMVDNFKKSSGERFDLGGYGNWYFTNCVYKTHPNWSDYHFYTDKCLPLTKDELFMKPTSRNYDPENPYKLKKSSMARNAGCVIPWPEGATDLVGQPRVNGSVVDIGCYEGWYPEHGGLLLLVR